MHRDSLYAGHLIAVVLTHPNRLMSGVLQVARPVAFALPRCRSPTVKGVAGWSAYRVGSTMLSVACWSARCVYSTMPSDTYRQGRCHAVGRPLSGALRIDRD
ncbi:hypothetical protein B296_00012426 [Ensete ventricosum]|uniref:Uncharacterized protein n=1 Tax=Ensete ventricosum TaxID=4639 RepID=A0A427AUY8_ENSVE|nr:hypothetical protein B296_00012426 [Ensete ventricosum]